MVNTARSNNIELFTSLINVKAMYKVVLEVISGYRANVFRIYF